MPRRGNVQPGTVDATYKHGRDSSYMNTVLWRRGALVEMWCRHNGHKLLSVEISRLVRLGIFLRVFDVSKISVFSLSKFYSYKTRHDDADRACT